MQESPGLSQRLRWWGLLIMGGVAVPFLVTGFYYVLPGSSPRVAFLSFPFLISMMFALAIRRTMWKPISFGLVAGSVLYGLVLMLILRRFSEGANAF